MFTLVLWNISSCWNLMLARFRWKNSAGLSFRYECFLSKSCHMFMLSLTSNTLHVTHFGCGLSSAPPDAKLSSIYRVSHKSPYHSKVRYFPELQHANRSHYMERRISNIFPDNDFEIDSCRICFTCILWRHTYLGAFLAHFWMPFKIFTLHVFHSKFQAESRKKNFSKFDLVMRWLCC